MMQHLKQNWPLIIGITLIGLISAVRFSQGDLQQDDYLVYATLIGRFQDIPLVTQRLLPGLPLLIWLGSAGALLPVWILGYSINMLAFAGSYWLLRKLNLNPIVAATILLFPPILLEQYTITATEPVFVFLLLAAVTLLPHSILGYALLAGSSVWVRLTGLALFPWWEVLMPRRSILEVFSAWAAFAVPFLLLMAFNSLAFGSDALLHQVGLYTQVGQSRLAVIELGRDVQEFWRAGMYRDLVSAAAYLMLFSGGWLLAIRNWLAGQKSLHQRVLIAIAGSLTLFVFSLGPAQFLREFARFLVPVFVVLGVLIHQLLAKLPRWTLILSWAVSAAIVLI